ncbi:plasmid mobilization relaxosome protein MobC [Mucilaginibacter limnophilus]|uniref:Plasmid mobilization relaxosome protein MobC n=1 Tax=Mucilaginibacter limnophilus TaxID=1932778 RepID=A0A437MLH4_9SPHI|nr:plasmid mobilization relaxosome protein MobC [Mucilaginibacter limnophilus]RVT98501.1 plasmid mobilization relaxosome protein MobC [Mucilaginibacter limnophilus]
MSEQENRSKWLKIRLKPSEEEALSKLFKKTTFQNLSEYGRAMILGKPVTVLIRDKAMDDMLEELLVLRRELSAIGNNLNQAVRNINAAHGNADTRMYMSLLGIINAKLEPAIREIKQRTADYAELWSQKLKAGKA